MRFDHEKNRSKFLLSKAGKSLVSMQLYKRKFVVDVDFESRESNLTIVKSKKEFSVKVRTLSKKENLPLGQNDFSDYDFIIACINIFDLPEYYIIPTNVDIEISGNTRDYITLNELEKFQDRWNLIK